VKYCQLFETGWFFNDFFEVNCVLEDVISEFGEIIDHGYMHTSSVLWQRHQSHILATNSIHTPDAVNLITHLMKVSKISNLEVTHRMNVCKLCHGNIHFNQCIGFLWIPDCTEVCNVDN